MTQEVKISKKNISALPETKNNVILVNTNAIYTDISNKKIHAKHEYNHKKF